MAAPQRSRREGGGIMRPPSPIVGLRTFVFQPNIVPGVGNGGFGRRDGGDRATVRPLIYHRSQAFPYSFRRTQGRDDAVNGAGFRMLPEIHSRWPPVGGSFWGCYGGGDGQLRAVFFSTAHSRRVLDLSDHFVEVLDGEQEEPPLMAHPDLFNIFPVVSDDDDDDDDGGEKSKEEEPKEEDDNEGGEEVFQEDQITTGSI